MVYSRMRRQSSMRESTSGQRCASFALGMRNKPWLAQQCVQTPLCPGSVQHMLHSANAQCLQKSNNGMEAR